jgi:hypothetical protein
MAGDPLAGDCPGPAVGSGQLDESVIVLDAERHLAAEGVGFEPTVTLARHNDFQVPSHL